MTIGVLLLILSVTTAIAAPFLNRHPLVMKRSKRKREQRILAERKALARKTHPATRSYTHVPAQFYEGPVPSHEDCPVLPGEEILFGWIAGDLGYGWIADALRATREAGEQ